MPLGYFLIKSFLVQLRFAGAIVPEQLLRIYDHLFHAPLGLAPKDTRSPFGESVPISLLD